MTARALMFCTALCAAIVCTPSVSARAEVEQPEEVQLLQAAPEFTSSFNREVDALTRAKFDRLLRQPPLGSEATDRYERTVADIKGSDNALQGVSDGDSSAAAVTYDVIIQPGHYNRPPGKLGTTGARVSERALVGYIASGIASALRQKGLKVLLVQADPRASIFHTKVFLAVHADGSAVPCRGKASLGYDQSNSATILAMHAIGWGLAQALGLTYEKFAADNYTPNEAKYYMFQKVNASLMKGILEIGELTCSTEEPKLIVGANAISANVARAVEFVVGH